MPDRIPTLLIAAGAILAVPANAQTPPPPLTSAPVTVLSPGAAFPPGAEVLSVEGELLGVLDRVEARPGGERILHIRRADGSTTTAPAIMASRGERAVVLEWTRAEFESAGAAATPAPIASTAPSPPT